MDVPRRTPWSVPVVTHLVTHPKLGRSRSCWLPVASAMGQPPLTDAVEVAFESGVPDTEGGVVDEHWAERATAATVTHAR